MEVKNQVTPDMQVAMDFFSQAEDGPFVMLNLLKFKEKAENDSDSGSSGREAYQRYGQVASQCIQKVGGRMIFTGAVTGLLLGEIEENWDMVALVEYPSLEAFRNMTALPEFVEASKHRSAGLAGQLNIKIKPTSPVR
ncbi:MAG: DUF1330 domain-containing protein [Gammaproteobacteria bacterium]|nr:DUF1330 domain-containing protein [Gammaproteobacteria bacterium]